MLNNDDVIIADDIIIDDDSSDAQAIEQFEKSHLSQDEIDFINKVCKQ